MDNILKINEENYLVLKTTEINGEEYSYVAKIEENDINGEFYLYRKDTVSGEYVKITNSEELKRILTLVMADMN